MEKEPFNEWIESERQYEKLVIEKPEAGQKGKVLADTEANSDVTQAKVNNL